MVVPVLFYFLMKHYAAFCNSSTSVHSYQKCTRTPFSLHLCQHLWVFVFLIIVILTGVKLHLTVVLICILIRIRDIEPFFICLLTNWISFLTSIYLASFAFFIKLFVILVLNATFPYIFWILKPYQLDDLQISSLLFHRLSLHFIVSFISLKAYYFLIVSLKTF